MVRLLSIISIVIALVLFPPAALAVISNNAVPGDVTYPIKRILEDGIFAVASLNSVTKAWFAAARSDRRFKEFTTLIAQGKKGEETLNELVEQTQIAASQIAQVKDESQKQKLVLELSESIKKYDQGLEQLSTPAQTSQVPAPTPVVQPTPRSTSTPQPTFVPPALPTATPHPTPAPTIAPTPYPTAYPTSVPTPNPADADRQRQIEEARRQLDEIRRRLKEQQRQREHNSQVGSQGQQIRQERRENEAKDDSKDRPRRGKD